MGSDSCRCDVDDCHFVLFMFMGAVFAAYCIHVYLFVLVEAEQVPVSMKFDLRIGILPRHEPCCTGS